ncbi:MAG: hypothetical protein COU63_01870 [Candidatus Pacebacteria bacterium CG10_big_fil_rev_8_21_14_0_10_36_11]|nr:DUF167 domain-containing protein [Candidatus Pacearchaeota archaeon]OIP73672.1 MAG: hypothetical protein AUK08_03855 [Candidatus Pacebacteria bacterium CG2_30_36_39]PIR64746.1 MAG: hypothetical protein COU63_01870 [Candidatus Pacebacteria bacterium CG10_big_fil_rev_8_21_14_0_10_36_11]PJC43062.1 MAG: hypothetical protein CO040_01220 [Candidatus Pacebacteria bacterium CG_4_9_14_0_2_um_filter_36_8]
MKISVKVHPNSKKPRIIKNDLENFDAYVNQPATDNRANNAVIESLAEYFQIKTSSIRLRLGNKSKTKVFEINKFR